MPEALILDFKGVSEADYQAVNKQLGIDMHAGQGDWPAGLLSHAGGMADDGIFIVSEVRSSRDAQEAFLASRLGAAFAAAGLTAAPAIGWAPLLAYHRTDA
jgi:hypothetical protein